MFASAYNDGVEGDPRIMLVDIQEFINPEVRVDAKPGHTDLLDNNSGAMTIHKPQG
jgi:hypothetical protein